ncbi:hypothetical protein EOM82_09285, partial [bacterium]|nr:hypothetical protein [bacterium]
MYKNLTDNKKHNNKKFNALSFALMFVVIFFIIAILTFGVELIGIDSDLAATVNLTSDIQTAEAAYVNPSSDNLSFAVGNLGTQYALSRPTQYWGYQQIGGNYNYGGEFKNNNSEEVGIYNGGGGNTVVMFTRIKLDATLVALRQQGVLNLSLASEFRSGWDRDDGGFGIGRASIATHNNITSSSTVSSLSLTTVNYHSWGWAVGWWGADISHSGTLDSTGVYASDEYVYILFFVKETGAAGWCLKNPKITLSFNQDFDLKAKKYHASNNGESGEAAHTNGNAKYGKNTAPNTNLTTSATGSLAFDTYNTYYSLTASDVPGYKFIGWHEYLNNYTDFSV